MLDTVMTGLLVTHVGAGVVALLAGLGAIVAPKGGRRHNLAGKVYVATMGFVVVTAVPLAVHVENWFLLAIAVFSGYLVFAGYRVVSRRRRRVTDWTGVDLAGHGVMILAGTVMIGVGTYRSVTGPPGLAPVLVVFGAIGVTLAGNTLRELRHDPSQRVSWFRNHIAFMGGAYIATVTATVTVNLTMLPPLVRWLGPTAVGVPLIVYANRRYGRIFGTGQSASHGA